MKKWTIAALGFSAGLFLVSLGHARSKDDCETAWARSVRSYLTQNRKAGPDGKVPKTMDEEELSAQAWNSAFGPACALEQEGKKADARVEAAAIGVKILSTLDPRGCVNFMDVYMQSTKAQDVCDMAARAGSAQLREKIRSTIPSK